jgi:hypothetical protein
MTQPFKVTGGTLQLDLPAKTAAPSKDGARAIRAALRSVTAKHAQALTGYTYYEVIDLWLGPWGNAGYPIGYGKYYNVLFNGNAKLARSPDARRWVEETTIKLQEALTDFIVKKYEAGQLGRLTEAELRMAAFESHAKAYTDGGLVLVVLLDPLMIPIIATIPYKEFNPTSKDFGPTVLQVFETLGRVVSTGTVIGIAAVMPAHSGFLRRAVAADAQRQREEMQLGQQLGRIKAAIDAGHMDHIPWLDKIVADLNGKRFNDSGAARFARDVVQAATARKTLVTTKQREMLKAAPDEVRRQTGLR